jgi:FAD/FMN-containing dehydrogenase
MSLYRPFPRKINRLSHFKNQLGHDASVTPTQASECKLPVEGWRFTYSMGSTTALAQIGTIAKAINSTEFGGGKVQCAELEIESARQLADVLKHSRDERIFVFRGAPGNRPEKLAKLFPNEAQPLQAVFLNFNRLNRIVEHVQGDQVLSIECGIKLSELNSYLSNHGQWLPIEYASDNLTLADVLETGDGGCLEPFNSGVKHLVLGMELAVTDGDLIKTGGKIVKNVTGYDLSKLFTGSHNWLAIPHMVHVRLYSKSEKENAFIASAANPQDLVALANNLRATGLPAYSIEAIDSRLLLKAAQSDKLSESSCLGKADIERFVESAGDLGNLLIVSTRGHEEVADEVIKALKLAVEANGLAVVEADAAIANQVQRLCSEIFAVCNTKCMELSVAASGMSYFFQTNWPGGKPLWSARPTSGRLRLGIAGTNDVEDMIFELKQFARLVNKDGMQPITVAYPNERYEVIVRKLASDALTDCGINEVVRRLKSQYDPQGILNPLVNFC